ncbi:class I SAM-dependent methyltransferase [Frankia gtarii]|uniref:class I SAM-dependent methyltransferase n=1 Tax=Frankia gtarii TaxID=2950102 RepID=UPI0021BE5829|nr:class I SAM-dependent methyltransferase [Frankia gtarii]
MTSSDRERLRATFTEDAELYDRARPGYPPRMFDDLTGMVGLGAGCRVLEIGCGTGQATVPLARRGCRIVAVELGPQMAAVARRNLAGYRDDVQVLDAAFEDWPLPAEPFDVVFAATAFHWIDPAVRVERSAAALRPGGALATVATSHVAGGTEGFFVEVQNCYERFDPKTPPNLRLSTADEIVEDDEEITRSGRFDAATFLRYEWELHYTSAEYLDVLRTYSGHRALQPAARRDLLHCIEHLIEHDYEGGITKRYLTELRVARRRK